ncbi:DNA-binding Lrp family transcriptional regulator [Bradyrhizobium elkanii]|nr:DNA-binding Lrp family transcriptional regulator [Bradyrhizobium elkanii]
MHYSLKLQDPQSRRLGARIAARPRFEVPRCHLLKCACVQDTDVAKIFASYLLSFGGFPARHEHFALQFTSGLEPIMQYDRTDARILEIVQKNNRLTSEVIGEMAGLSATACQRRLKRLRSEGIIEADVSIVSAKAVGRPIQMLVMVSLERERSDIIDRFKKAIKSSVEVVNGFYVTGDADFVLYITARSMEDYEQFTRRFFYENPNIKGFKTLVVVDRVKVGFAVPIETPPEN